MIDQQNAAREIEVLSQRLRDHQYEYYVSSRPSISDREYDRLFDRLLSLESQFSSLIKPDSPSQRIGSDLSHELPEVKHSIPVLSLDKAYTPEDLQKWIEKKCQTAAIPLSFVLEEKIDGASILLYYRRGLLSRAVTRGNGLVGNDVTANVKTIGAVPLRLARPISVTVRGEIFITKTLFERINARLEVPYANPRNLAAGTLRRVKSSSAAEIPLDIFIYEGFFDEPHKTHVEILEKLAALNFKLNQHIGLFSEKNDLAQIQARHPSWQTGRLVDLFHTLEQARQQRQALDYEIDGLVLKVNEIEARERLGFTGHHPRWAVAFKFEAPEAVTTVERIDVQIGRTGRITPVARVKPVQVSGSVVSNATLHNQDTIDLLELAIGDTVSVSKRGDVIPAVERVLEKNQAGNSTWSMPARCPGCSTPLIKQGAHLFCPNTDCPDQVRGRLYFFAGRNQIDIENLGSETIDLLIEQDLVHDIVDLYRFDPEKLFDLPGFGPKKVSLIKKSLKRSRERPYRVVLTSLGIPEIGPKVVELLIEAGFRDIDRLVAAAATGDPEIFISIHGIGEKTAATIIESFSSPEVQRLIEGLKQAGLNFATRQQERPHGSAIFEGQTWCVTGSFERFKPRNLAMEEVKKRGGRVTASISTRTTHLLAGPGAGGKLAKAQELGLTIVNEEDFLELIE